MRGEVEKICDFQPISRCISVWREIGPRLLLITNRKSYIDSRLDDDFERQNRGFYLFLGNFWL